MTIPVLTQLIADPAKSANTGQAKHLPGDVDSGDAEKTAAFEDIMKEKELPPKHGMPNASADATHDLPTKDLTDDTEQVSAKSDQTDVGKEQVADATDDITSMAHDMLPSRKTVIIPDLPAGKALQGSEEVVPARAIEAGPKLDVQRPESATVHQTGRADLTKESIAPEIAVFNRSQRTETPTTPQDVKGQGNITLPGTPRNVIPNIASNQTHLGHGKQHAVTEPGRTAPPPEAELPLTADRASASLATELTAKTPNQPPVGAQVAASAIAAKMSAAETRPRAERIAAQAEASEPAQAMMATKSKVLGAPALAQPMLAQQIAANAPGLQAAVKDNKIQSLHSDGDTEVLNFDVRGTQTPSSTSTQAHAVSTLNARGDIPRAIAMQIGNAVRGMSDRPVDVSLNPEELGRVRLSISASESGVILSVLAERPETLDLMRRNAEQLAKEFADLGFSSIELAFGKGEGGTANGDHDHDTSRQDNARNTPAEPDAPDTSGSPPVSIMLDGSGGLDIRI